MKAIVWSKDNCTYCDQAKKLLEESLPKVTQFLMDFLCCVFLIF